MDLMMTARETGLFETAINISCFADSCEVAERAGACMPLPGPEIERTADSAARWLLSSGKRNFLFLTPEIALAERMLVFSDDIEIIFSLPCDMDEETRKRVENNLPGGSVGRGRGRGRRPPARVSLLEEPFFPESFYPLNSMIVACGYEAAGRCMVLSETYRLLEHYSGFRGRKAFIPYRGLSRAVRYDGWRETGADLVRMKGGEADE